MSEQSVKRTVSIQIDEQRQETNEKACVKLTTTFTTYGTVRYEWDQSRTVTPPTSPIFVHVAKFGRDKEPSEWTSREARDFAYTLLAAADYADEQEKQARDELHYGSKRTGKGRA